MRYILIIVISLINFNSYASVFASSYQEKLQKFNQQRAENKSAMSDKDKQVMQDAGEYLNKYLPNPGIQVGEKAPDFSLINAFGKTIQLNEELAKGPVVLVFYRGAWCPYCNLHLHALQESLPAFNKLGARLITITPQQPDKSAEQVKKDGFLFEVLSDLDNSAMKNYRLYFELPDALVQLYKKFGINIETYNGDGRNVLPVPASFIIDQQGVVRAMQANTDYKQRMEPQVMLDALIKINAEKQR